MARFLIHLYYLISGLVSRSDGRPALEIKIKSDCTDVDFDKAITMQFRRIIYLKDRLDDDTMGEVMTSLRRFQKPLENALAIPEGNIVLNIEEGSCKLLLYYPRPELKDLVIGSKEQLSKLANEVATSRFPNIQARVNIEIEETNLAGIYV